MHTTAALLPLAIALSAFVPGAFAERSLHISVTDGRTFIYNKNGATARTSITSGASDVLPGPYVNDMAFILTSAERGDFKCHFKGTVRDDRPANFLFGRDKLCLEDNGVRVVCDRACN